MPRHIHIHDAPHSHHADILMLRNVMVKHGHSRPIYYRNKNSRPPPLWVYSQCPCLVCTMPIKAEDFVYKEDPEFVLKLQSLIALWLISSSPLQFPPHLVFEEVLRSKYLPQSVPMNKPTPGRLKGIIKIY